MITITDLQRFKQEGRRFAMLTAYDYTMARLLDQAGIPCLLVGDSLAQTMLGHSTTLPVTMDEMVHHARAVARGSSNALLVGDLPFMAYQTSVEQGMLAAGRFLKEGGMHAVKLEGGESMELVHRMTSSGIPVMGHLGLTPQAVRQMGGFKVQGRTAESAALILAKARELEEAGAFSLVLEGVPDQLARSITESVQIPTIGIGAGPHCDGQVLVIHDLLGLTTTHLPRFVKRYANLGEEITRAVRTFAEEVEVGIFPTAEHSYSAKPTETAAHMPR